MRQKMYFLCAHVLTGSLGDASIEADVFWCSQMRMKTFGDYGFGVDFLNQTRWDSLQHWGIQGVTLPSSQRLYLYSVTRCLHILTLGCIQFCGTADRKTSHCRQGSVSLEFEDTDEHSRPVFGQRWPIANSGLPPVFINKLLLEIVTHSFTHCRRPCWCYRGRVEPLWQTSYGSQIHNYWRSGSLKKKKKTVLTPVLEPS